MKRNGFSELSHRGLQTAVLINICIITIDKMTMCDVIPHSLKGVAYSVKPRGNYPLTLRFPSILRNFRIFQLIVLFLQLTTSLF